ncbi:hypothetical protein ACMFLR_27210 [Delftia tsuruhatensis]|uniref:hypothetical protein n=1 Tax=Delftia tsuruhatensis TaxID=180282 RepID=UPI0039BD19FC
MTKHSREIDRPGVGDLHTVRVVTQRPRLAHAAQSWVSAYQCAELLDQVIEHQLGGIGVCKMLISTQK